MKRIVTEELLEQYKSYLLSQEKGEATVNKYLRDLGKLAGFAGGQELDKEMVISYKNSLKEKGYKISSINSFLAAANQFFQFMNWNDLKVRLFTVQKAAFCPEKKCLSSYLPFTKNTIVKLFDFTF